MSLPVNLQADPTQDTQRRELACGFPQCDGGHGEHQRITIGWNTRGNIAVRLERHYGTNERGQGVGTYYNWKTCRGKDREAYRRARDKAREMLAAGGRPIVDGSNDMAEIRDLVNHRFAAGWAS